MYLINQKSEILDALTSKRIALRKLIALKQAELNQLTKDFNLVGNKMDLERAKIEYMQAKNEQMKSILHAMTSNSYSNSRGILNIKKVEYNTETLEEQLKKAKENL